VLSLIDLLIRLKGTEHAEESLFLMALSHYNLGDFETSTMYFDQYVKTYPKGVYAESARFMSGRASYLQSPDPRLDQSPTYTAIASLQKFLDYYPMSGKRSEVNDMIFSCRTPRPAEFAKRVLYYIWEHIQKLHKRKA
jgi:outer membrane protein assembly factor BamD